MAAPEGYTKLGNVGYADKGVYSADATYNKYNAVYHEGSTYVALKDNLHGVTPADGANWRYMAKGFTEASADAITVIDTSGIIDGTKNKKTILQTFLDKVGDFIINKAVTNDALLLKLANYVAKTDIVQVESTATNKVPSSAYLKQVKDSIDSNLANIGGDLILSAATYNSHEIDMSWTELSTKIQSGDFKGLQVGDYKDIVMTTGEHARVELSGINTYINTGDNPILSTPHIVFTFRDCLETTYQYNNNQTNAGGYGATPLAATINTTIYDTLPSDLKSVIKEIRRLDNNKSGFAWASRKLWLPKETEIYGYSNSPYDVGSVQLPIFAYSYRHIIKGLGMGAAERGSQINWWTATPAADDNASFVRIYANGNFTAAGGAKSSYGIAPAFVIG